MNAQEMADAHMMLCGQIMVPQPVWVKGHSGQVTDGRIGRPAVHIAPISWLPASVANEVLGHIKRAKQ